MSQPDPTADSLARFYSRHHTVLLRYVAARFPGLCRARVEDAVAASFVVAMEHPERFGRAMRQGGEYRLLGLFRVIAWRAARADLGRRHHRAELGRDGLLSLVGGGRPGQDLAVFVRHDLDRALEAALLDAGAGPELGADLRSAVLDRFATGDSDTDVARRHGLRREYVNRAKRAVQREVAALLSA